ncbi:helix-turn-helix domain-containing protein [Caldicellulosiruptor owensensis]|nr:helix-turn-helix domain-containing protein [Caldicellulosiruptor owensensis]
MEKLLEAGFGIRKIAKLLNRNASTSCTFKDTSRDNF